MSDNSDIKWISVKLPVTEYREALDLQRKIVAAKNNEIINDDMVLLLEHPATFTLGLRGGLENLTVSRTFLKKLNIPIVQVERGGNITFHGPGQLVVYPIIDLNKAGLKVTTYVDALEEIMIRVAADWGIQAERNRANRGIWVGNNKLGSIGISVRRGVSFHGFSLNVNLSLKPFSWIHPCGLQDMGVTSMNRELSKHLSMRQAYGAVRRHMASVFGVSLVRTGLSQIQTLLTDAEEQLSSVCRC